MKLQINNLSSKIQKEKQNTLKNKREVLKNKIKEYVKNYGGESIEISDTQIRTKENIKNIFEQFLLENNENIEQDIFKNFEQINSQQEQTSEKTKNIIGQTINSYIESKEVLGDLKKFPIGQKINLLKQINGENFKYKINNSENNNSEYKKISELNKQEKIDLINKYFSNLNPKLELKILQEKRLSYEEGEKNSYLHLDKNNGAIRNYYQIMSNIKYLEKKLKNNEYINFPSLNKVYNSLQTNYEAKTPVYLAGETGGGKTELAKKFLQDKINKLHPENKNKSPKEKIISMVINSNEDTGSSELESTKELVIEEFTDGEGKKQTLVVSKEIFQGLKKGMEEGIPVILDEVNKMPQGTLGILNEYLSQVQNSGIYNGHSKVKKGFFVIMTGNEGENYLSRNELDPSIKRRVDTFKYPYLDKKDLAYFTISQLNNFNKYEKQDLESQGKLQNKSQNKLNNKNQITVEKGFKKSFEGFINGFNQIQKQFEENRIKEDGEEKEFIYKIPAPDIGTIKNIIKKYNILNKNNKINTTLEREIFRNYITKDIYNLDSQIYLFNIFKQNGLYKNFNEIIPQNIENLLNKSSEEKYELLQKIEEFIEEENQKINKKTEQNNKTEEITKTELALNFHDELNNVGEDELLKNIEENTEVSIENTEENQQNNQELETSKVSDLSEIDDLTKIVDTERFEYATENEKKIIENWKEKYPDWSVENLNKIIFHKDGIEFNTEGLEGKKIQRENLKVEKQNGKLPEGVYEIPEDELKDLSPEEAEKIKDEQLFTFDSAMEESKKQGLNLPSDIQWKSMIDFMPGGDEDEKSVNLRLILGLELSGSRGTDGHFYSQGYYGLYWSSPEDNSPNVRYQGFNSSYEYTHFSIKNDAFSVRCFKD